MGVMALSVTMAWIFGVDAVGTPDRSVAVLLFAISLTVFGLNLLGDAVRDLTDPHLRGGLG